MCVRMFMHAVIHKSFHLRTLACMRVNTHNTHLALMDVHTYLNMNISNHISQFHADVCKYITPASMSVYYMSVHVVSLL